MNNVRELTQAFDDFFVDVEFIADNEYLMNELLTNCMETLYHMNKEYLDLEAAFPDIYDDMVIR